MAAIPPAGLIDRKLSRPRRAAFHRLAVAEVERLTEDSVAVTFTVPARLAQAYRFAPGQHVTIRSDHGGTGSRRSYSIASPAPDGPLRVGIKLLPGGAFSTWATTDLSPGAELEVMTPAGAFGPQVRPDQASRYVSLAAGSGITPILSIVHTVLAREPDSHLTLLYGSRSSDAIMFGEELADLKDRHPARFQMLHFLSREPQVVPLRAGRLDAAKLDGMLGSLVDLDADGWYLCGPADAVATWSATLLVRGVDPGRVHREFFHVGPVLAAPRRVRELGGPARRVHFTLDGRSSEVEIGPAEAVLDGVLRVRADAPFACRGGVCGTCRARLTEGQVEMAANFALEPDELERGFVLTCQARPVSDTVRVDYDR